MIGSEEWRETASGLNRDLFGQQTRNGLLNYS